MLTRTLLIAALWSAQAAAQAEGLWPPLTPAAQLDATAHWLDDMAERERDDALEWEQDQRARALERRLDDLPFVCPPCTSRLAAPTPETTR